MMIATVIVCLSQGCDQTRQFTAFDPPRNYCTHSLWQLDLAQMLGDVQYEIGRVDCRIHKVEPRKDAR